MNAAAAAETIAAMRELGRIEPSDEALMALVESLAAACDVEPGNASLFREYRAALNDLRGVGVGNSSADEIGSLIEALRSAAAVGDSPPARKAKPRR